MKTQIEKQDFEMPIIIVCSCVNWHCEAAVPVVRESHDRGDWPTHSASLDYR